MNLNQQDRFAAMIRMADRLGRTIRDRYDMLSELNGKSEAEKRCILTSAADLYDVLKDFNDLIYRLRTIQDNLRNPEKPPRGVKKAKAKSPELAGHPFF